MGDNREFGYEYEKAGEEERRWHPPTRWYVIGDVHGCDDALDEIFFKIREDIRQNPHTSIKVILVGDYIDRGPDSYKVVEQVHYAKKDPRGTFLDKIPVGNGWENYDPRINIEVVALRGNHEDMLEQAILSCYNTESFELRMTSLSGNVQNWLHNGGIQAIQSYMRNLETEDFLLPPHHVAFYKELLANQYAEFCGPDGDQTWMVIHAGINPEAALEHQRDYDYLWIRNEYINFDFETGGYHNNKLRVISGHTPVKQVVHVGGKVLLDTGCVFGINLSCCVFETDKEFKPLRILTAKTKKPFVK